MKRLTFWALKTQTHSDVHFALGKECRLAIGEKRIDYAVAVMVGGGLDIGLRREIEIHAFDADYGLAHLPNDVNDHQNLQRLSSGVVFRLA